MLIGGPSPNPAPAVTEEPRAPGSADHSGSTPGTQRTPTRAPRKIVSHPVVALVMDRLEASAASETFHYGKLGPLKLFVFWCSLVLGH